MHLLFLTPQLPYPPRQGAAIRNYNLLAHLARHHTIDLITFAPSGALNAEMAPDDNPLAAICRRVAVLPHPTTSLRERLRALIASPLPDMAHRLESPAFHHQVTTWLADGGYDIVQVEGIELAQYMRHALNARVPVVFDNHNCETLLQRRTALSDLHAVTRWHAAAYSLVQWAKLRRYEAAVCRAAQAVVAVSRPDALALRGLAPQATITVVPNAINLADYPNTQVLGPQTRQSADPARFTLLFTGKMDYRPNVDAALWFAQHVWPRVKAALPTAHWQIVGMNPHPRLAPLAARPGIEITGGVPDIRPFLAAADVCIIPMRVGGGTRLKALEAMASAKPVVSTSLGVEGLDVRHGRELLIADTPADFAAALRTLAEDRAAYGRLATQLGSNARHFVATQYTWSQFIPILEDLYRQLRASAA